MKKFIIFCFCLLFSSSSQAGGLFTGCMASGFGTHVECSASTPTLCRPDTQAYITRVEADGGTVINVPMVEAAYQLLADYNLTPLVWVDANFGVKKDGSDLVATLYDLSSNNYDATQATSSYQPLWNAAQQNGMATVQFDGVDNYLDEGTSLGKPASFTAFTLFKSSDIANLNAAWMSRTSISNTWWGSIIHYTASGDLGLMISNQADAAYTGGYTSSSAIDTVNYYLRTDRYASGVSTQYIYLNNGAAKSLTYASTNATTNSGTSFDFKIGRYGNGTVYFTGYIGDLVIFPSSLSDANRGYVRDFLNGYYSIW